MLSKSRITFVLRNSDNEGFDIYIYYPGRYSSNFISFTLSSTVACNMIPGTVLFTVTSHLRERTGCKKQHEKRFFLNFEKVEIFGLNG